MLRLLASSLSFAAILASGVVSFQAPINNELAWAATLHSRITATAAADSGRCVVAMAGSQLTVLDGSGYVLWEKPTLEKTDRADGDAIAVSPSCDWVAVTSGGKPPHVQILERDGPGRVVRLAEAINDDESNRLWEPRSAAIAPDGSLLAIGTAFDRVALVNREGRVVQRIRTSDISYPVVVEFTADGKRLVITAFYAVGLMDLAGNWQWHEQYASLSPGRNLQFFAAWFTPAHGPQGGNVALLDSGGKAVWDRAVWEPSVAIAPNEQYVAVSAIPDDAVDLDASGTMPVPNQLRKELRLIDRSGKDMATKRIQASVQFVTDDSRCVVIRDGRDLVGVDLKLQEQWRLTGLGRPFTRMGSDLLLQSDSQTLRAFRLPSCGH